MTGSGSRNCTRRLRPSRISVPGSNGTQRSPRGRGPVPDAPSFDTERANDLTVGSFNLERFYNDVEENNGAVKLNTAAYEGRLKKASLAVRNVMRMPDILGLEEVEGQQNCILTPSREVRRRSITCC